jgi:hypothetical protein
VPCVLSAAASEIHEVTWFDIQHATAVPPRRPDAVDSSAPYLSRRPPVRKGYSKRPGLLFHGSG